MTVTVVQLFLPTELTGSAATLYTVPASPVQVLLARGRIRFTNTSNAAVVVTAYDVPSGGSVGVGNLFLPGVSVPANSNLDVDVPVIAAGGFIQAFAGTASVVVASALDGILFS